MKKTTFSMIIFFLLILSSFSQTKKINCIILIDGKLPTSGTLQGFIKYKDKTQKFDTIFFFYAPGMIEISEEDFMKFQIFPDTAIVNIHLEFTVFHKKNRHTIYNYSTDFPVIGLLYNNYIVLSISNFNKKKGTYYFDYITSTFQKPSGYNKRVKIFH